MTTPPGPHAMTAQAGAVAWYCTREIQSGRVIDPPCITANPAYVRAHPGYDWKPLHTDPPAAVPVEALEGLLDKAQFLVDGLDEEYVAWPTRVLMLRAELTELTQLIKERSNG